LLLPGMTGYIGDLPHSISMFEGIPANHTVSGSLATEVGWLNSAGSSQPGLRNFIPGIFFEGIAYPFSSTLILDSMPQAGKVGILDFPASAWWGPSAAAGAILIEPSSIIEKTKEGFSIWGSDGGPWGADDLFRNPSLSVEGNYQHGIQAGFGGTENFDILTKERWVQTDDAQFESDFLGTQSGSQVNWYAAFADLRLFSPNFQTLQVKPYFQSAQLGSLSTQDTGGFLNYLLNVAGLVQAHFGAGFDHEDEKMVTGPVQINKGFVQTTDFFDVLGPLTFDGALRVDFSSVADTQFSTLLGLQAVQGAFTFMGDYAKGVLTTPLEDVQQVDLGFSFQPTSEWEVGVKYLHLTMGGNSLDGARFELGLDHDSPLLFLIRGTKLQFAEQVLQNPDGSLLYDTSGKWVFSLLPRTRFTVRGRVLSGQAVFGEVGADYSATDHISLFASLANINNLPVSWPDVTTPTGRVLWAGIQGQF